MGLSNSKAIAIAPGSSDLTTEVKELKKKVSFLEEQSKREAVAFRAREREVLARRLGEASPRLKFVRAGLEKSQTSRRDRQTPGKPSLGDF